MATSRIEREARFHDEAFTDTPREAAGKFYAVAAGAKAHYHRLVEDAGKGKRALGIGVGLGGYAFELAELGADVVGIDISEVGVDRALKKVAEEGMGDHMEFRVMNAEALEFSDNSFDLVYGSGILHHLDIGKICRELQRVLKPDGKGIFFEPLGHNPLINLYRRLTPQMRTEDEHPLRTKDLRLLSQHFPATKLTYFHLISICAAAFRKLPGFGVVWRLLELLDGIILAIPWFRRYAWIVVIEIGKQQQFPERA